MSRILNAALETGRTRIYFGLPAVLFDGQVMG